MFCEQNKAWGNEDELWEELFDLNHQRVLEQNKQYFSQKKKMIEETRKKENLKLEDLIAQINSCVHKVVGESGDESEYIEEQKIQAPIASEYRKRYREENHSRFSHGPVTQHTYRRTKRTKIESVEKEQLSDSKITPHQGMMLQNLLETSNQKVQYEDRDLEKSEQDQYQDLGYNQDSFKKYQYKDLDSVEKRVPGCYAGERC